MDRIARVRRQPGGQPLPHQLPGRLGLALPAQDQPEPGPGAESLGTMIDRPLVPRDRAGFGPAPRQPEEGQARERRCPYRSYLAREERGLRVRVRQPREFARPIAAIVRCPVQFLQQRVADLPVLAGRQVGCFRVDVSMPALLRPPQHRVGLPEAHEPARGGPRRARGEGGTEVHRLGIAPVPGEPEDERAAMVVLRRVHPLDDQRRQPGTLDGREPRQGWPGGLHLGHPPRDVHIG